LEGRTRIRFEPLNEGEKTMQAFAYSNPTSVADAAKGAAGANAKILAGGQSLLPAMKLGLAAPESLVDLGQIAELKGISVSGNVVKIGAIPALADLASHIGDRQVRNRGTLGGSLANNDPAACYPAAALGLGATIHTNTRDIKADDFFTGLYETALKEGEIITAVSFPVPEKAAWQKFKQPASRFSIVGVFVSKGSQGVRVAVTGAGACVFRASSLEAKLQGNWSGAALQGATFPADGLNSDLHGSAEYRAALIPVLAQRAVAAS
jgi:carbon-monoxide dehydrogenase medium subunit